ncbi:MAG: PAS domain S-box protein [Polyangiaceae bacterium]|nr:PAS domain S-box protein [Polyangiaceae bacterium]
MSLHKLPSNEAGDQESLSNRADEGVMRVRAELEARVHELDAANEQLRLIFENAPNGILTVDSNGIVHMVNAQTERMFGYRADELIGKNIDMLVPMTARHNHEHHRRDFFSNPGARQMGHLRWLEGRRKDGSHITIQVTLTPLPFRHSSQVMAFVTDMTRARQLETERDQIAQKMVETQKLESLGILAGGIAHDFNNLLTGIMATAGMLVDTARNPDELHESANMILASSRRAAELCQQLLAYAGRSKFVFQAQDVSALVETTSKLALTSFVRKGPQITFDLAPNLPLVFMDETQIRQVVMNLVINASEAVDPHGGVIAVRTGRMEVTPEVLHTAIVLENFDCGECVFIEVTDNGCGIKREDVRRIFEPFYSTKFTGRGLGLSAVLGIVRGHRGALTVTSEVERGTTFRVLLPRAAEQKHVTTIAPMPTLAQQSFTGKVLVADDEFAIRNACRRLLTRMGFEVEVVSDGLEGLERFKQNPGEFTLVMLDLTMPRMGGAEAFTEMKRLYPEGRFMLMSGFSVDDAHASVGGHALPDAFLPKPFDHVALTAALAQALG